MSGLPWCSVSIGRSRKEVSGRKISQNIPDINSRRCLSPPARRCLFFRTSVLALTQKCDANSSTRNSISDVLSPQRLPWGVPAVEPLPLVVVYPCQRESSNHPGRRLAAVIDTLYLALACRSHRSPRMDHLRLTQSLPIMPQFLYHNRVTSPPSARSTFRRRFRNIETLRRWRMEIYCCLLPRASFSFVFFHRVSWSSFI